MLTGVGLTLACPCSTQALKRGHVVSGRDQHELGKMMTPQVNGDSLLYPLSTSSVFRMPLHPPLLRSSFFHSLASSSSSSSCALFSDGDPLLLPLFLLLFILLFTSRAPPVLRPPAQALAWGRGGLGYEDSILFY